MKKSKFLGNILFWLTLIAPFIAFCLASTIGEADIFGAAGIVRYSYVMLLFIPIGILSIWFGFKLKMDNEKYKKLFIISFICIPLLIIFGSYRLIFNSIFSYNVDEVSNIEASIDFEIPDEIKIATTKLDSYNVSYIKIIDDESTVLFEEKIKNSPLWQEDLNFILKSLLPLEIQYESVTFEYYTFYNATSNEYNVAPPSGESECIFIAYDCDLQKLIVLYDYKINVS